MYGREAPVASVSMMQTLRGRGSTCAGAVQCQVGMGLVFKASLFWHGCEASNEAAYVRTGQSSKDTGVRDAGIM